MDENPYQTSETSILESGPSKNSKGKSILKIILIGFGVLFLLLILLFVWAGVSTSKSYAKFEHKAEPFIINFLQEQSPWNYEKAKPHLSKEWLKVVSEEDSVKLLNFYNKLGQLESIGDVTWQQCSQQVGSIERCDFSVIAKYEKGEAAVHFGFSLENDSLKLLQLRVNSDAFMEP